MAAVFNPLLEATENAIAIIVQNLCNQVIEFQESIAAREPGQRFPGAVEVGLLVRLISCLDKLRRFIAPVKIDKEVGSFVSFLKQSDAELGKIVAQKYKEFNAGKSTPASQRYESHSQQPAPATSAPEIQPITATSKNHPAPAEQPGEDIEYFPQQVEKAEEVPGIDQEEIIKPPLFLELKKRRQPIYDDELPPAPKFIAGDFDHLITRQQLDAHPIAIKDYNTYWHVINTPCKRADEILFNGSYEKIYILQYKLRYLHYLRSTVSFQMKYNTP